MKAKWMILSAAGSLALLALIFGVNARPGMRALAGEVNRNGASPSEATLSISAVLTETISYQGLLEEDGIPVSGEREMTFRLYEDSACTVQVGGDIVMADVQIDNGLFSVPLGVNQEDFHGQGMWLEVEVEATPIGCRAILPVPYALSLRPGAVISDTGSSVTLSSEGTGLYGLHSSSTGTAPGVYGATNSTSSSANAVVGQVSSTSPGGFSSGVRGINKGTGGLGIGVYGSQDGSGWGVYGTVSGDGLGVYGSAGGDDGIGLYGLHSSSAGTAPGVYGATGSTSSSANAVVGQVSSTSPGGFSAGVRGINKGTGGFGIGVYGSQDGSGWGVYGSAAGYAGYFSGDIRVTGTCTGCSLSYLGINAGTQALEKGDLVAVSGVSDPLQGSNTPLLNVTLLDASSAQALVGVVLSRAEHVGVQGEGGQLIDNVVQSQGTASPGDYVVIVVQGLEQVKVDAQDGAVHAGDTLSVSNGARGFAALASQDAQGRVLGQAMESLSEGQGLIWVMIDLSR